MRPSPQMLRALALAAGLMARAAGAADVELGGQADFVYDDNVLGREHDKISDGELLIAPTAEINERFGSAEARLWVKPTYEYFLDEESLRGWNYDATGALTWNIDPTTTLSLEDTFRRYRNFRLLTTGVDPGGTGTELGARDRFTQNLVRLSALHRPSPASQLSLSASYALWDFSEASRVDQENFSGTVQYLHAVTRALSLGGDASFTRAEFDRSLARAAAHSDYYNASALLVYEPTPGYSVRASVGPTLVRSPRGEASRLIDVPGFVTSSGFRVGIPGQCPTLPTGEVIADFDDPACMVVVPFFFAPLFPLDAVVPIREPFPDRNSWTYFADISAKREWERGTLELAYRRDEGTTSSVGFSSVADTVEARGSYRLTRRLTLSASALWEDRKASDELDYLWVLEPAPAFSSLLVPVELIPVTGVFAKERVKSVTTYLSAQYQVGRRARVGAWVSWRDQTATEGSAFNDAERLRVWLGVSYELEPFRW